MAESPSSPLPDGLHWYPNGQSAYSGSLWRLYQRLERLFLSWAAECEAVEYGFPTFLPSAELAKLDYFRSFPHLMTFPIALDPADTNLKRFASDPLDAQGNIQLTTTCPVHDVLTPAACYHFYVRFQGGQLKSPLFLTTRATCFRREAYYLPLERQWSFSMREIVCIGSDEEVRSFLSRYRTRVDSFFKENTLGIKWLEATDPFFDPTRNPKFLAQKIGPLKTEMVFEDRLAIGSINFHRYYFGDAFGIARDGEPAFSGCVAFGVDRWISAFLKRFGPDERAWPLPPL